MFGGITSLRICNIFCILHLATNECTTATSKIWSTIYSTCITSSGTLLNSLSKNKKIQLNTILYKFQNGHLYTSVPTSTSTRTSWLFWSTEKNTMQISPVNRPVPPAPTELYTRQQIRNAQATRQQPQQMAQIQKPSYSTVVQFYL